jgi:GNT-I family
MLTHNAVSRCDREIVRMTQSSDWHRPSRLRPLLLHGAHGAVLDQLFVVYLIMLFGCREERLVYYRIANHYKFIMQQLFGCRRYERLIIVEDDMLFAPDFFPYFEATSKILDQAPTPPLALRCCPPDYNCCRACGCCNNCSCRQRYL